MSNARTITADQGPLPDTWDALNVLRALRPIQDDVDYDNAAELIDRLAMLEEPTKDQADYLETLTQLIEGYDEEHFADDFKDITPLESLQYLLEKNEMNASALGDLLGERSLGSKILRGERELSKNHIRILCERFKVSADLFLR